MKTSLGKITELKYHRRVIAVMMTVVLFVTSWAIAPAPFLSANGDKPYITMEGEKVTSLVLKENTEIELQAASTFEGAVKYCWQIRDMHQEGRWIQIARGTNKELAVSYALIGSMLNSNEQAEIRCKIIYNNREYFSESVEIQVSHHVYDNSPAEQMIPVNTYKKQQTYRTKVKAAEEEHKTYTILINYLFENGALAFEPYGATVAKGSDLVTGVTSPTVVGYRPVYQVDGADAEVVELNIKNVQDDLTINVVYIPTIVNYSIHHHLQNLLDDDYSVQFDLIITGKGLTGDIVAEGLQLTQNELPGFSALTYERLPIAADGSTVVEIRYNRNYYLVDFDMNGGYGTEPVYTRYESIVGANTPTRHGYIFDGWELVSYGGRTPTDEEKSKYEISDTKTIMLPDANLTYRAKWITQETTYTMVFWKENANDNGYSYWGSKKVEGILSGTTVSGSDDVPDSVTTTKINGEEVNEKEYFTYNSRLTDKNVVVEGDGSTIVNVYYTRNTYTLTFKATGKCGLEEHTHGINCNSSLICHTHNDSCEKSLNCDLTEHTAHTDDCRICGFAYEHTHSDSCCNHTHTLDCYKAEKGDLVLDNTHGNKTESEMTNLGNGLYSYTTGSIFPTTHYYLKLDENWYCSNYEGFLGINAGNQNKINLSCSHTTHNDNCCKKNKKEHSHNDSCYKDSLHTHTSSCYLYSCGNTEHTHTKDCYSECTKIVHTHTTNCTNANRENTVYSITAKYQAEIKDEFAIKNSVGDDYTGYWWDDANNTVFSSWIVSLDTMPGANITFEGEYKGKNATIWYYTEVLPGEEFESDLTGSDARHYGLYKEVKTVKSGKLTKDEEFHNIEGFSRGNFYPSNIFSSTQENNYLYYTRNSYALKFFNHNEYLTDMQEDVLYDAPIKSYYFDEVEYPSTLEANAYEFKGWYTTAECFEGTECNFETQKMPAGELTLYAKWAPVTHTVRVFKDATLSEQWGEDQIVDHNAFAYSPDVNIQNGNYIFQGWFYMDEGKEKAFVFNGIPVLDDMDIYAKWSSHVPVQYTIHYVLKTTGETIADSTVGMTIAGNNKTFIAKAGDELYEGYRMGYYPLANSHTITMSADGTHEYTFEYVYQEKMPYLVRYINAETGAVVHEEKKVSENTLSVVTETFIKKEGMMPDAYQKRLVLSADTTDQDGDGIFDANVITFYYSSNDEDAYYRIVHKVANIEGDNYLEYRAEEKIGEIGEEYTVEALTITGFTFDGSLTKINDVSTPTTGTTVTATLPKEGMLIELYYKRNSVNYTVSYLDYTSKKQIAEPDKYSGKFGEQVITYALDLTAKGYDLVSENARTLTLATNEEYNKIEFYYQEQIVSLKYELVGPSEGGSLTQYSENVSAITGKANGSSPIVKNGYEFKGWYEDVACTKAVDASLIDAATNQLKPVNESGIWKSKTYYAKIDAIETDITIEVKNTSKLDTEQAYIFHVVGKKDTNTEGIDLTVTVICDGKAEGKTTITKLPVGEYTITEMTNWSWRYENGKVEQELTLKYSEEGTTITYENTREHVKWLDGNDVKTNKFQ